MFVSWRIARGYQQACLCLLVTAALIDYALGECYFPREWRGSWFQSGLENVRIHESSIEPKGICIDHQRDYYLLENSRNHCHQCLLIFKKHHNIIQYKESYCVGRDSIEVTCRSIRVEAILYTLVRQPPITVPSPFQDAYNFVYNNNSGGACANDENYAQQCASPAKFVFKFRQCNPSYVAYTSDRDLEFSCLATWKDGSYHYMYGGFTGAGIIDKEEQYRCFMYKVQGTVVYLSMSADATCRGLRTPQDGPLTLELTRDTYGWPIPNCAFPEWLTRTSWRDLYGRHVYSHDSFGEVMTLTYQRLPDRPGHVRNAYRCMKTTNTVNSQEEEVATVLSYTSDDCEAKLQCLQIIKRRHNLIEIHRGEYISGHTDRCSPQHLGTFDSKHILIPEYQESIPCPYGGQAFHERSGTTCATDMQSGCDVTTQMHMTSSCLTQPATTLECLETWSEHGKQYVIMRETERMKSPANCFSFTESGHDIIFQVDPMCNHATTPITAKTSYSFHPRPQDCMQLADSSKSLIRSRSDDHVSYNLTKEAAIVVDNVKQHHSDKSVQSDSHGDHSSSSSALSSSIGLTSCLRTILWVLWVGSVLACLRL